VNKLMDWKRVKDLFVLDDRLPRCSGEGCSKRTECLRYVQRNTFSHHTKAVTPAKNLCAVTSPKLKMFMKIEKGDLIPEHAE
jgi:hypothetical protein